MRTEQITWSKRLSFAFYENDTAEQIRILLSIFILIVYRHKTVNFVSDCFAYLYALVNISFLIRLFAR